LVLDGSPGPIWDDETATEEEVEQLLLGIRNQQSPAVKRIQDCFRTPDGRPCVSVNYDTTHFPTPNSLDAHFQMDHYSGPAKLCHVSCLCVKLKGNQLTVLQPPAQLQP